MTYDFNFWNEHIDACMTALGIVGATAVIANHKETLYTHGYGLKNIKTQEKPSPITLFPIASISKNFTGVVLALMVQDGYLHFNDPIQKYLPDTQIGPKELWAKITCADLLTHGTGLDESFMDDRYTLLEGGRDAILEALKNAVPSAPYKTKYQYFNPTYYIIPLLIEKFYAIGWQEFMQDRLFTPLGFQHTTASHQVMLTRDHTQFYIWDEKGNPHDTGTSRVSDKWNMAGGVCSSAAGLGKWIQFHLNCGAPLVDAAIFENLYHPYTVMTPTPSYAVARYAMERYGLTHYGLGLKVGGINDNPIYLHEGAIACARSIFVLMPKQNIGAAILTNIGEHDAASAAMFYLMDKILDLPFVDYKQYLCYKTRQFMLDTEK